MTTAPIATSSTAPWRRWLAVIILGIAAFIMVTTELAPIGTLVSIAADMHASTATTGLIVTLYAWLAALFALLAMFKFGELPPRPLLVVLMALVTLSNLLAILANTLTLLLAARFFGACAQGVFWALVGTLGAKLVPAHQLGKATSIIFGGVSVASVLGVPLVNVISHHWGWRYAFGMLGGLSLITCLALSIGIPSLARGKALRIATLQAVLRLPGLLRLYGVVGLAIIAHFAAFTFIETMLSERLALPDTWVALCLFVFGCAGILGNVVCGKLIDQHLKIVLLSALVVITVCLFCLGGTTLSGRWIALCIAFGWGMGGATLFVCLQTWVLKMAGDNALPASALYAAIFNAAIGGGAMLGAIVLGHGGIDGLSISAALVIALAGAITLSVPAPHPPSQ